jgi:hypothetical protein
VQKKTWDFQKNVARPLDEESRKGPVTQRNYRTHQYSSRTGKSTTKPLFSNAVITFQFRVAQFTAMISLNILSVCLIVGLSVHLLLTQDEFNSQHYTIKVSTGDIWIPESMNAGGHVYPYMATIVSMTCLLVLVLMIICFGSQFTG